MSFYASSFQFDGIPSETYGLTISEIDASANSSSMGSTSMEMTSRKIYRRATPYFYGGTPSENLSFDISIMSPKMDIDAEKSQLIQKWLFSSRKYKKLLIIQPDMQDRYYNCIFNNPQIIRVGNVIQGYTATVQCDAPYSWAFPQTVEYLYSSPVTDTTINFNNTSDDKGAYLYPITAITISNTGGNITLTNVSDANRVFSFTGLSANEIMTVDNSLQIISSSLGIRRMSNFNKKFFRLIPEMNTIRIQGNIAKLSITSQFVAKL